VFLWS